jgi:hypothetical protein
VANQAPDFEDLTDESPGDAGVPTLEPYDPAPEREQMRGCLAAGLVALLFLIVIGSLAALESRGPTVRELLDWVAVVLGPVVGLVGAVTGFYFGTKSRDSDPN